MQRTVATLTKQTTKGLSTWSFVICDGIHIAFGGTTNRCRTFRSMRQMKDCIQNFIFEYGYIADIKSTPKPIKKMQSVKTVIRQDSELPDDLQMDLWALQPSIQSEGLLEPESYSDEPELAIQDNAPVLVQAAPY